MTPITYKLRGGNGELFTSTEQEVMCSGAAETGKTVAAVLKAHAICESVPNTQGAIVRKAYNSLTGTVVRTYERVIQPEQRGIEIYGGNKPERFIYPNGSVIWMGGMDNASRVLSSERDFIYVNQAEELSLDDWETLVTRCTGRGAVVKHAQLFGDCNPAGSLHWIRKRTSLRLLVTKHTDNPSLYTDDGELTEQGVRSMAALDALTGIRRKRLRDGIWATAEGAVYDIFDPAIHVCRRDPQEIRRWFLAIDEGYTNPAVILLIGEDADKRHHCFREFYQRGVLQADVVQQAKAWFTNPLGYAMVQPGINPPQLIARCAKAAVDESAAGLIADLNHAGVSSAGAKGRVLDGINLVQNRLKPAGDGRPRYTVDPSCVNHINEFESYVWKPEKDVPEKENDHCLIAETLITTKRGEVPIIKVTTDDSVLTRAGWRKVIFSGRTGIQAQVMTANFSNGATITGTPDHKVWVEEKGFIALRYLLEGDTVLSCKGESLKKLFSMESNSSDTQLQKVGTNGLTIRQTENISRRESVGCTSKSGRQSTAQLEKDLKYTTKTTTRSIIKLAILNACPQGSTESITPDFCRNGSENGLKKLPQRIAQRPQIGMAQKQVSNGTSGTQKKSGKKEQMNSASASNVESNSKQNSAESGSSSARHIVKQNTEKSAALMMLKEPVCGVVKSFSQTNTSKPFFVRSSVVRISFTPDERRDVFDLTVEGEHEFFANGILVHNSLDAYRYLLDYLHDGQTGFTSPVGIMVGQAQSSPFSVDRLTPADLGLV